MAQRQSLSSGTSNRLSQRSSQESDQPEERRGLTSSPPALPDPLDGFFDDLMSLESNSGGGLHQQDSNSLGSGAASPMMAGHHDEDHHHPSSLSLSPTTHHMMTWRLTNPVHMEIQDNAKLPTFNLPVDRSGSAYNRRPLPAELSGPGAENRRGSYSPVSPSSATRTSNREESHQQQQHQQRNPQHNSLAELFLRNPQRRTMDATYAQVGALREHHRGLVAVGGGTSVHSSARNSRASSIDEKKYDGSSAPYDHHLASLMNNEDPLDALAAQVEPTPLSEIRRKQEEREIEQRYSYHGERYRQLPIPYLQSPPSSPGNRPAKAVIGSSPLASAVMDIAEAVATAAAIASQGPPTSTSAPSPRPGMPSPLALPSSPRKLSPSATSTTFQSRPDSTTSPAHGTDQSSSELQTLPHPLRSPPPFARPADRREGSTFGPPASIERASSQKSQYGFGPRHVVPSVPAPPEAAGTASKSYKQQRQDTRTKSSSTANPPVPASISTTTGPHHPTSASTDHSVDHSQHLGAAYERKKQRAKDARVKLNDSIEKLSVAINFSGSQSKHRLVQWTHLSAQGIVSHSSSSSSQSVGAKLFRECSHAAESAKKWDRPSFVGSAATVIQNLNAQCEMLLRELSVTRMPVAGGESAAAPVNGGIRRADNSCPNGSSGSSPAASKRPYDTDTGVGIGATAFKRLKADELSNGRSSALSVASSVSVTTSAKGETSPEEYPQSGSIWEHAKSISRIASFLDPIPLSRCNLVCKEWKRIFMRCQQWNVLAVQRFGQYNVRQWREKLEDEDEGITCLPFTLYNSMDRSNTMPHFDHDGMFLLGEACLPGKVGAWTFLVERSNGETLRSVIRPSNMPGSGAFTSLPIVELRTVIQNTGCHDGDVLVREQLKTVDASTRRRGACFEEVDWDDRFKRRILMLDGSARPAHVATSSFDSSQVMCRLKLFEAVVIVSFIHAKGCSTISKFVQRSNFTKVLVQISGGSTLPLVISFPRDVSHHLEH